MSMSIRTRSARALLNLLAAVSVVIVAAAPLIARADSGKDPQARALEVYTTFKSKNWNRLFDLSAIQGVDGSNREAARKGFIAGIAGEMEKSEQSRKQFDALVNAMSDLKAGKPVVSGVHATVPTSSVVKMNGRTLQLHGRIVLIWQGSEWKWDLTSGDSKQVEKASSEVFMFTPPTAKQP
jgi:hypothetical protein